MNKSLTQDRFTLLGGWLSKLGPDLKYELDILTRVEIFE